MTIFQDITTQGTTIFICGEREALRRETLDPLLASGISRFYFIKPKANLRRYLAEIADDRHLFSYVEHIDDIHIDGNNIIVCGFKPLSRDVIARLKREKPHAGMIFFDEKLGFFKQNWSEIPSVKIVEYSLERYVSDYISTHAKRTLYRSSDLVDKEGEFFTNRGEMLDFYRNFMEKTSQHCCKIIGMKGIGKRAFIRRLKFVMGLGENCFEIGFTDKSDDISYLLAQLLSKFGISYDERQLEGFHADRVLPVAAKLFHEFDKLPRAKMIFYRIDVIYDAANRQFYDPNIAAFFHQLLQRDTYPRHHNRIYCVANQNFAFPYHDDRNSTYTIQLNPIHPEHIQYILEHEFNSRGKPELAQAIMKYDFDAIAKLLGGHPQIAKLFVQACDHYPMDDIIRDAEFRRLFDEQKAAYLMQHIALSAAEERLLFYLSLFKAHFTFDAMKAIQPQPFTLVEQLRDKFLLEKEDFADGHSEYYVPSIIQDYARTRMDAPTMQTLQNQIAEYYQRKAENLKTPSPEALEAYRLALYHFSEAGNNEQEKQLMSYFKGIFLKKAQDAYQSEDYETAWHYYRELAQYTEFDEADASAYHICNAMFDKKAMNTLADTTLEKYPEQPPVTSDPTPKSDLTPGERERLERVLKDLHEQYALYEEMVKRLKKAVAIETNAAVKFQLEEQLKEPSAKYRDLMKEIAQLEKQLQG